VVSGGTDNHLFVADMRSKKTDGARMESLMDHVALFVNKNTVVGDKSALIPSGLRFGSPAMTTRGCKEKDFIEIMKFVERAVDIVNDINKKAKGTKLKDYKEVLKQELGRSDIHALKKDVNDFSANFPVPGGLL
jgi:glycine hydroxymethyltransferase